MCPSVLLPRCPTPGANGNNNRPCYSRPGPSSSRSVAHYPPCFIGPLWENRFHGWPLGTAVPLGGQMCFKLTNIYQRWQVEPPRCNRAALGDTRASANWSESFEAENKSIFFFKGGRYQEGAMARMHGSDWKTAVVPFFLSCAFI